MNPGQPIPFKSIWLWCLTIACGLVTAYLGFVALVSVWVGISNLSQPGCWIPILAGTSFFLFLSSLFIRTLKRLLGRIKDENVITISPRSPFIP